MATQLFPPHYALCRLSRRNAIDFWFVHSTLAPSGGQSAQLFSDKIDKQFAKEQDWYGKNGVNGPFLPHPIALLVQTTEDALTACMKGIVVMLLGAHDERTA